MTQLKVLHTHHYHLTAAQCNAQSELAPSQLIQQIIEVATEHADILGVGFKDLQRHGNLWVLSRVAFEMKRFPRLLEDYSLTTWIEAATSPNETSRFAAEAAKFSDTRAQYG